MLLPPNPPTLTPTAWHCWECPWRWCVRARDVKMCTCSWLFQAFCFSQTSWFKTVQNSGLFFFFCGTWLKFTANTNAKRHCYDLLRLPVKMAAEAKWPVICSTKWHQVARPDVRANKVAESAIVIQLSTAQRTFRHEAGTMMSTPKQKLRPSLGECGPQMWVDFPSFRSIEFHPFHVVYREFDQLPGLPYPREMDAVQDTAWINTFDEDKKILSTFGINFYSINLRINHPIIGLPDDLTHTQTYPYPISSRSYHNEEYDIESITSTTHRSIFQPGSLRPSRVNRLRAQSPGASSVARLSVWNRGRNSPAVVVQVFIHWRYIHVYIYIIYIYTYIYIIYI